jgi:hypothetical protein
MKKKYIRVVIVYGLCGRVRFPIGANFFLCHHFQTRPELFSLVSSFPDDEAAYV